jgi:hypothetical protein
MSRQSINVGTAANDGTGDLLRSAFQKTEANFVEIYAGTFLGKPTVRNSRIQTGTAASYSVSFPTGTVAGDTMFIFIGHTKSINQPSGWSFWDNQTGANWNGAFFSRIASNADISTGSVTITTGTSGTGVIAIITMIGSPISYDWYGSNLQQTGTTSTATLVTDGSVRNAKSLGLYFGSNNTSSTNTISPGTQQQQAIVAGGSGVINADSNVIDYGVTPTFTYGTAGTGHYEAFVLLRAAM